jgi:hypothetical protein
MWIDKFHICRSSMNLNALCPKEDFGISTFGENRGGNPFEHMICEISTGTQTAGSQGGHMSTGVKIKGGTRGGRT